MRKGKIMIIYHESSKTFHLYNNEISYIMCVLPNGHLGNLYFGKRIHDREDFSHLLEMKQRPMTACVYEGNRKFSLEHLKLEYPVYGSSDYRYPAVEILQENGSRISDFTYVSYTIAAGKPKLQGLPATYTEKDEEAQTLCVKLKDEVTGIVLELLYTIFTQRGIITRSARFTNEGTSSVHLLNAMSLSLDLPDSDYVWMQFSGAWSRERHVKERRLEQGIQSVGSIRGNSSHEHNPFIVLRRPSATENAGEVMGFSLIYSGNHRMQAEVDTHDTTRITVGINPQNFDWKLDCGESFQTPEAVVVFSDKGLNGMSQTFHKLYQKRLARGYWRDRPRPILNNNWEATYFDFTEDRLVEIAAKAKECGVELFVLDDGWFGARSNDYAGLGDWVANRERLPQGIKTELQLIQAQVNPHFLYNTLDTIVWLVEGGMQQDAVDMITSLSVFFRTSLSKGKDIIPLSEEKRHTLSYLEIQQSRYRDIMEFEINIPPELDEVMVPKLTLQPLAENALYHGIKNKRGKGKILIEGFNLGDDMMLRVTDNGQGMTPERLYEVQEAIRTGERAGFGLAAVSERIVLYYGPGYGLKISSTEGEGTVMEVYMAKKINLDNNSRTVLWPADRDLRRSAK